VDAQKTHLAEMIDNWVQDIARHSDNEDHVDEQILENMIDYMAPFKQLLDTCTKLEMNLLIQQYDGLYRFANLLERLAQAIQDGVITVPEDAPMPPGWPQAAVTLSPSHPLTPSSPSSIPHCPPPPFMLSYSQASSVFRRCRRPDITIHFKLSSL